jgi:hypothetical protein
VADSTRNSKPQLVAVEQAKYLWEEYRYRHDLIWRLLFRMTAVAVLLSIAPFTIDDLARQRAGAWVDALPALALVVIGGFVLWFELDLFQPIDQAYTDVQKDALGKEVRMETSHVFVRVVQVYPVVLCSSCWPCSRRAVVPRLAIPRVPSSDCCPRHESQLRAQASAIRP